MKARVVGASVSAKVLRAACTKADVPAKDVRTVGARAWVELPGEQRDGMLARLAETLATGLMVIDVDVPEAAASDPAVPASVAAGVQASRATYRGVEEDVSEEARQLVQTGRVPAAAGPSELAWALTGDPSASGSAEEQWANALVDKLVADGALELRGSERPLAGLAQVLQTPGRDLGDRLLADLIDSPTIDEVFADADQLAAAARATKPKR